MLFGVGRAICCAVITLIAVQSSWAQIEQTKGDFQDKFRQLEEILPTPNIYRTASGAPGHGYWQQKADYVIKVTLDDDQQRLTASETITYHNNSPDSLRYLWLQLDQNRFEKHSDEVKTSTFDSTTRQSFGAMKEVFYRENFDGGYTIHAVKDAQGQPLAHNLNKTMMRIDLPQPLASGGVVTFSVDWSYNIPDAITIGARGGHEYFKDDKNYLYGLAQWFPRMVAYTDTNGWHHKQFLGRGEFTLEFGDYDVTITAPADHIVAATGELQNPEAVLTPAQRDRLARARDAKKPIYIVTPDEALAAEKGKAKDTKSWQFKAQNVRDFAFASSRKFIWDAQGYHQQSDGRVIMAMSFFPKEGDPLWSKYSTEAVIHTMEVYSKYSFPYPYPTAQSVNGPISGGMEYPMITFNGPGRTELGKDGKRTYGERAKYGLIGVVIHEIGHNYFPMIVNTDERQWTWMDEGINSFLQFLAEQEWEEGYPSRRGDPRRIVDYMLSQNQVPIMSNSESILQFGNNGYNKPATAMNILRETVMGRELFDFAFREYANRWMFKRPYPADLFRTMEDASGVDLDWFWRGWFYTTDHVDISLDKLTLAKIDSQNPDIEEKKKRAEKAEERPNIYVLRDKGKKRRVDRDPSLKDFYNENDEFTVTPKMRTDYQKMYDDLEDWEKQLLARNENIYFLEFSNLGGLVMPIILNIEYNKGEPEILRIPAEIWRYNPKRAIKMISTDREIRSIIVDPYWETADADISNNHWPRQEVPTRLELFKQKKSRNMMREVEDGKAKN